ncbi:MAG: AraC family transcriptional regulator [bacterium]
MINEYHSSGIRMTTCIAASLRQWNNPNLSAPYWRLYWNRNVGAQVRLSDRITPLDPGHLVLISPNTPFASHHSKVMEHLYMHFVTPPPYTGLPPSVFCIPIDNATQKRAGELYNYSEEGTPLCNRGVMLAFSLIHQALAQVPDELLKHENCNTCILDAMRLMEQSHQTPPSNDTLARIARMNTNAFIRLFKRQTGVSPQAYSTSKRVEQACLLLHHSSLGIKEIAERTGFCDRYHFTRVFTRIRGVPPAEFRQQTYATIKNQSSP